MGVINITPDSFSDGGKFNSFQKIQAFINSNRQSVSIFDFGAESTAPMNAKVVAEQEIQRFELLVKNLDSLHLKNHTLSIDTYKPEVIKFLLPHLKDYRVIWNDVSGVVDDETLKIVNDNNIQYVLSHTNIPSKFDTSDHMNYIDKSDMVSFFKNLEEKLLKNMSYFSLDKLILDCCFGFSKTREQNLWLLENYNMLDSKIKKSTNLIGISRKSFLRDPIESDLKDHKVFELVKKRQSQILGTILSQSENQNFIFRVHEPRDIADL